MKKIKYVILSFICIYCLGNFTSCSDSFSDIEKSQYITKNESALNIISPNGNKIAKDIRELKLSTTKMISESNGGYDVDYEITNIEYVPVDKGFIAIIKYHMENGKEGSYILASSLSNLKFKDPSSIVFRSTRSGGITIENGDGKKIRISCVGKCDLPIEPGNSCGNVAFDSEKKEASCTCIDCSILIEELN